MATLNRRTRIAVALSGAVLATAAGSLVAVGAEARPDGAIRYPPGATATRFAGEAFDVCAAPSLETMRAWLASPYRAIGVYISGDLRACRQPNLTASWVRAVSLMGWKLLPLDVGRQAPCTRFSQTISRAPATARKQGEGAATRSVDAARALGILPGSALYSDIEHYSSRDAPCSAGVRAYLDGWTRALHSAGYLAGVYGNLSSAMRDVATAQKAANETGGQAGLALRPDVLWNAHWDRRKDLTDWAGVPTFTWAAHQRVKQYRGDHSVQYGGRRLVIDSNIVNAVVATVGYPVPRAAVVGVVARAAPMATAPAVRVLGPGEDGAVCLTHPSLSAARWVQLTGGGWLPHSVALGDVAGRLSTCATPYPVQAGLTPLRLGAADTAVSPGALAGGTLAWIVCETAGASSGRSSYWQRLETGQWISGAHLRRAQRHNDASATPTCPA